MRRADARAGEGPLTEAMYYVMVALTEPLHGYGIMRAVKEMSGGRVELGPGTLYGVLTNLMGKSHIRRLPARDVDGRRKIYALTDRGRQVLKGEVARLSELAQAGRIAAAKNGG